jgi:hypothetical protein
LELLENTIHVAVVSLRKRLLHGKDPLEQSLQWCCLGVRQFLQISELAAGVQAKVVESSEFPLLLEVSLDLLAKEVAVKN